MQNSLSKINWMDHNERLDQLIDTAHDLDTQRIHAGFEAEVVKICTDKACFILKTWNKNSKPDVQFQYQLLQVLSEYGLFVSKPISWGIDESGNAVLLTMYDGSPLRDIDLGTLKDIAMILTRIHQFSLEKMNDLKIPKYDFITYFYPNIEQYSDLHQYVIHFVDQANIRQDCLIHGDFHLENIVEDKGQLKIIDWTNGQLGDGRYDFMWSLSLSNIYNPTNEFPPIFSSTYLTYFPMGKSEIDLFEALAFLRWMLLYRQNHVPVLNHTVEKVRRLMDANQLLKGINLL